MNTDMNPMAAMPSGEMPDDEGPYADEAEMYAMEETAGMDPAEVGTIDAMSMLAPEEIQALTAAITPEIAAILMKVAPQLAGILGPMGMPSPTESIDQAAMMMQQQQMMATENPLLGLTM